VVTSSNLCDQSLAIMLKYIVSRKDHYTLYHRVSTLTIKEFNIPI
jgi:hypothetical protein